MKKYLLPAALLALPLLSGCGGTKVKRLDTGAVMDISGKWNDTDSRLTAEAMIEDCISRPWIGEAAASTGEKPSVIVGTVRNRSNEHINTAVFVQDLQRALINSGRVTFVASKEERGEVREERFDQETHASEETRKAPGQEMGADFMLSGNINTIVDREGGKGVVLYQVNLKLLGMKNNQIVWVGQKKIKKYVKRSGSTW